jgi:catechol 2,3-dioxygenase-like lactoylglutathione lyase family enzyme
METSGPDKAVVFEGVAPILRVRDLAASLRYYLDVLGFTIDWETPQIAAVSRGNCCLFLSEGDQGHPGAWVWIGVSDADALFAEYSARGAIIRNPPNNFPWALEMQVADPDGNVLRLGSEAKENQVYGEWLDMEDNRWIMTPEGGWRRVARV